MKSISFAIAFVAVLLNTPVFSQYTGPGGSGKLYTCAEIQQNAAKLDKSDALVKVEGYIIERVSKEDYWFQDETGRIMLEIKEKNLPKEAFNESTLVEIIGEVDYDLLEEVEIEVEIIRIK